MIKFDQPPNFGFDLYSSGAKTTGIFSGFYSSMLFYYQKHPNLKPIKIHIAKNMWISEHIFPSEF